MKTGQLKQKYLCYIMLGATAGFKTFYQRVVKIRVVFLNKGN